MEKKTAMTDPIDAAFTITVDDGYRNAYVSCSDAKNGGKKFTKTELMTAISMKGIRYNLNLSPIDRMFETGDLSTSFVVSSCTEPVDGIDGSIEYLFETNNAIAPKEDENGIVDYHDLGHIKNITEGTVIAKITPPTLGEKGTDVRGVTIQNFPGKKAPYIVGKGTKLSDDELSIIAAIDGHLRWEKNKFVIDETVTITQDVDAGIGNIDFIGSVIIKGGVMEGYVIKSAKNITVNGNVTGSTLIAGGNISIMQGCINSSVNVKGDCKIGFCENSNIKVCGKFISQAIVNSNTYCEGELTSSTGKGAIVGGSTTCLSNITVNSIGSDTYAKTMITLGNNAILAEERVTANDKIKTLEKQIIQLTQIADTLNAQKKNGIKLTEERENMLLTSIRSRFAAQGEIVNAKKRITEIDNEISTNLGLCITCKKELYPGTTIKINTARRSISDLAIRCKIFLDDDGEIAIKPL